MKCLAAALSVFLVLAIGEAGAGFDEGVAAHERGDYASALREFERFPRRATPPPSYNLGAMCRDGGGVPQDYVEADK